MVASDITAMGDRFTYLRGVDEAAFVDAWARHVNEPPSAVLRRLARGLPWEPRIVNAQSEGGVLGIEITFHEDGESKMLTARRFDFTNRVVHHDGFFIEQDRDQRRGIGKVFLRNSDDFYAEHGLSVAIVDAGGVNGGYTWARYGFVPDDWPAVQGALRNNLEGLRGRLNPQDHDDLLTTINDIDPHALHDLTLVDVEVDGVKVGLHLLNDVRWSGRLDREDDVAYGVFRSYVEGVVVRDVEPEHLEGR